MLKSDSWYAGYCAGKRGASQQHNDPKMDNGDFIVGYAIGDRDRRNDDIIDDFIRAQKEQIE